MWFGTICVWCQYLIAYAEQMNSSPSDINWRILEIQKKKVEWPECKELNFIYSHRYVCSSSDKSSFGYKADCARYSSSLISSPLESRKLAVYRFELVKSWAIIIWHYFITFPFLVQPKKLSTVSHQASEACKLHKLKLSHIFSVIEVGFFIYS